MLSEELGLQKLLEGREVPYIVCFLVFYVLELDQDQRQSRRSLDREGENKREMAYLSHLRSVLGHWPNPLPNFSPQFV